jgi:hypothetical protein
MRFISKGLLENGTETLQVFKEENAEAETEAAQTQRWFAGHHRPTRWWLGIYGRF